MANEKNEQQPKDEKLRYLRRGEVRTMEKDVSALREKEAQKERERMAKLRVQEQAQKEGERQAEAQEEFLARKKAAEEMKKKEEDLVRLRREREEKEKALAAGETEELKGRKEGFKEAMGEVQSREEAERRRFLERVAAKAEGREEAPEPPKTEPPKPEIPKPEIPQAPKIKIPKIGEKIKKAREYGPYGVAPKNVWLRIILILLALAIFAAVATFWYWYFMVRSEAPEEIFQEQPMEEPKDLEEPETTALEITDIILGFGYHVPSSPRIINTIIIHTIYNDLGGDIFSLEGILEEYRIYKVAAHYLIDRNGNIFQTAPEEAISYHAGASRMPDGRTSVNDFSIGIEAVNHIDTTLTEKQYQSLAKLVGHLKQKYDMPDKNILGHKDIAPERKTDPWNFDWQYFNSLIE